MIAVDLENYFLSLRATLKTFQAMSLHKSFFVYNLKTVARVAADLEGYFLSFLISLKGSPGNILQGKRKSEEKLEAVLFFIQLYLLTL